MRPLLGCCCCCCFCYFSSLHHKLAESADLEKGTARTRRLAYLKYLQVEEEEHHHTNRRNSNKKAKHIFLARSLWKPSKRHLDILLQFLPQPITPRSSSSKFVVLLQEPKPQHGNKNDAILYTIFNFSVTIPDRVRYQPPPSRRVSHRTAALPANNCIVELRSAVQNILLF